MRVTPNKSIFQSNVRRLPGSNLNIAINALNRAEKIGYQYAKSNAPISPLAGLTGNRYPNFTRINWLKGLNKCNQFVGDVLTISGFEMPVFKMKDGSLHYKNAERLPAESSYFTKITDLRSLQPGDLIVVDWTKPGEDGAHVEVVTNINYQSGDLFLTGASKDGAKERNRNSYFSAIRFRPELGGWQKANGSVIYILRPIKSRI